ncbi:MULTISPECIES: redoxin domain-containing protein [unclassified Paracoccus (in: a-proteobacteria)]|uniref:redoxin domain-containing protein n=1 Tax=unclassified Paracoccus (in: a-proteobacteria) TaxID=2688777 RepID=UPI0012B21289|nr:MULTISPECIES: redoxin domain-containing protein [unclassified Paracoccus (in: a-proteobacteria)]UXU76524.1 redoxin domain-containing protein [Paracoccus sp. SMMA_5]UXU82409.1 redoxin domain-containing protein [Paracoccus sp. SMMA_5_TC]
MNLLVFSNVLLWIIMLIQLGVCFALARQIGILFERVSPVGAMISDSGPELGDQVAPLELPNLNGPGLTLGQGGGRAQLVFFLSTSCPICKALLPALKSIRADEGNWLDVVLASDGREALHRRLIEAEGLQAFPYVLSPELGMRFRVAKLPFAVLIDAQGRVRAKGLINSREQLESLFTASETGIPSYQAAIAGVTS